MMNTEKTRYVPLAKNGKPKMVNQELPQEVINAIKSIDTSNSSGKRIRDAYLVKLRAANWTLAVLGNASGISRERVRQIEQQSHDLSLADGLPVPSAPVWVAVRNPKPVTLPDPEILERLKELKVYAQQVRSNSSRYRDEAEEYTKLLNDCLDKGVTVYRLAKLLDVTHGALMFRLVRYGYKETNGKSKAYTKIMEENRKRS